MGVQEKEEACGDPQEYSASLACVCVCVCVCVYVSLSAGQLKGHRLMVTVRKGGTDFREMPGDKGTNNQTNQTLNMHGPLPFSKCFPIINLVNPLNNPMKYTGQMLCPIKEW